MEADTTTADQIIIALAEQLGRARALTDRESRWLERALWRVDGYNRLKTRRWAEDDAKLRRMLREGKRPAQIAIRLKRTTRAIYRRMYKLGLTCGNGGNGSVARLEAAA